MEQDVFLILPQVAMRPKEEQGVFAEDVLRALPFGPLAYKPEAKQMFEVLARAWLRSPLGQPRDIAIEHLLRHAFDVVQRIPLDILKHFTRYVYPYSGRALGRAVARLCLVIATEQVCDGESKRVRQVVFPRDKMAAAMAA